MKKNLNKDSTFVMIMRTGYIKTKVKKAFLIFESNVV